MNADRLRRIGAVTRALVQVRRRPDLDALRTAPDAVTLARVALVPAGRNLGVAISLLPAPERREATAALLACRVLDAFEDLGGNRHVRRTALLAAAAYLCGGPDVPPALRGVVVRRDSEAVDLVLAARIQDVRELVAALPADGTARVRAMLGDVAGVMADNLGHGLARETYSDGVLGRVTRHACELVMSRPLAAPELCASLGTLAQLANDLRDAECALYGVTTTDELSRHIFLRLPGRAMAAFTLLEEMAGGIRSRGARAAAAYMMITTSGFLCRQAGTRPPYRRLFRPAAAVWSAASGRSFAAAVHRVRAAADTAVVGVISAAEPDRATGSLSLFARTVPAASVAGRPSVLCGLLVDATFRLVDDLPAGPLTGDLPQPDVLRMMIADHLAFDALTQLRPDDIGGMHALADLFQHTALEGATA